MNEVVIDAEGNEGLGIRELIDARELLFFLMWREIRVRYAHTVLGVLWTVLQPLATMALFSVIFSRIASVAPAGVPEHTHHEERSLPRSHGRSLFALDQLHEGAHQVSAWSGQAERPRSHAEWHAGRDDVQAEHAALQHRDEVQQGS